MEWWRYIRTKKFTNKKRALEEVNVIGHWDNMHLQYPVLQIPRPFRDRIRSRVTRFYGNYQCCMPFYKDFYKCAYEVGQPVEHEECWKEFRDMRECENMWKTKIRMWTIAKKRHDEGLDFLEPPPQYLFHRPHITFRKDTKL